MWYINLRKNVGSWNFEFFSWGQTLLKSISKNELENSESTSNLGPMTCAPSVTWGQVADYGSSDPLVLRYFGLILEIFESIFFIFGVISISNSQQYFSWNKVNSLLGHPWNIHIFYKQPIYKQQGLNSIFLKQLSPQISRHEQLQCIILLKHFLSFLCINTCKIKQLWVFTSPKKI